MKWKKKICLVSFYVWFFLIQFDWIWFGWIWFVGFVDLIQFSDVFGEENYVEVWLDGEGSRVADRLEAGMLLMGFCLCWAACGPPTSELNKGLRSGWSGVGFQICQFPGGWFICGQPPAGGFWQFDLQTWSQIANYLQPWCTPLPV
jgi:hypothetical protein